MGYVCATHRGRIDPAHGGCAPLHIDYDAETRAMEAMAAADARLTYEREVFPEGVSPDTDSPWIVFDPMDPAEVNVARFATEDEARAYILKRRG